MLVGAQGWRGGGCVLDALSCGLPPAAYSTRRLTASYRGKVLNVRRSSDNTALDIGFVGNGLDAATLAVFVGSGSGYVTTWYNQGTGGAAYNVVQASAAYQPVIVSSGANETFGGVPAIYFSGATNIRLTTAAAVQVVSGSTGAFTANAVSKQTSNAVYGLVVGQYTSNSSDAGSIWGLSPNAYGYVNRYAAFCLTAAGTYVAVNSSVLSSDVDTEVFDGTTLAIYSNGASGGTVTPGGSPKTGAGVLSVGCISVNSAASMEGYISEIVVLPSVLSAADRATLEVNQGAYYGVSGVTQ